MYRLHIGSLHGAIICKPYRHYFYIVQLLLQVLIMILLRISRILLIFLFLKLLAYNFMILDYYFLFTTHILLMQVICMCLECMLSTLVHGNTMYGHARQYCSPCMRACHKYYAQILPIMYMRVRRYPFTNPNCQNCSVLIDLC